MQVEVTGTVCGRVRNPGHLCSNYCNGACQRFSEMCRLVSVREKNNSIHFNKDRNKESKRKKNRQRI
jgi:hypothetical protein